VDPVSARHADAIKAEQPALYSKSTVDDAIKAIFSSCIKHWKANEEAVARDRSAEAVHQMRVALRRMGTALTDFRDIIADTRFSWLKRESKWLVTSLGPARDWDVFLAELLAPVEAARPNDTSLAVLRRAAEAKREHGYERAQSTIGSRRYSKFASRVDSWLATESWLKANEKEKKLVGGPAEKFSARLLSKRHEQVLARGRDFPSLSAPERHKLRIAFKKLRYTGEFFTSFHLGKQQDDYFHIVTRMQDSLGHLNDIAVAEHLLEQLPIAKDRAGYLARSLGTLIGWHAHVALASESEAEANWRVFCSCDLYW
jgi:CHAD domain-containing protein